MVERILQTTFHSGFGACGGPARGEATAGARSVVHSETWGVRAMKRRQFVAVSALALAMPASALAGGGQVEYSRAAFDELLQNGKPFLLDFYTTW